MKRNPAESSAYRTNLPNLIQACDSMLTSNIAVRCFTLWTMAGNPLEPIVMFIVGIDRTHALNFHQSGMVGINEIHVRCNIHR